ncbi:MAG: DNA methylase [Bacteroidetes bacterium]|nr:DNA methylase [Bacteroidota bacterium]
MDLFWHNYKFFPYEKKFALREIESLLTPKNIEEKGNSITLKFPQNHTLFNKLVYFSHARIEENLLETIQFQYENTLKLHEKAKSKRQNTRYSVHGLHEYKGKFNPQVVKVLYNIFGIKPGDKILDPFCGSGTSLVEAAHSHIDALGTDINPLAVMIANAKIASLNMPWRRLLDLKKSFFEIFDRLKDDIVLSNDTRTQYLRSWFPEDTLIKMEALRLATSSIEEPANSIFLIIVSNLLREYSLQEPSDLRIRRRNSPFPEKPFIAAIENSIDSFVHQLKRFQSDFGIMSSKNTAYNLDIRIFDEKEIKQKESFDFAITSPPYATALPYIDTQRLSLVWLNLINASQIKELESELIGSREFKMKLEQEKWNTNLHKNKLNLPESIHTFCKKLSNSLISSDGFRKKALPSLLYRYFYDMEVAFQSVYNQLKPEKYFALIVGHNHTMIGGKRTEINTPELLTFVGEKIGFQIEEVTKLEAYHRYGLNSSNAVQSESLIVFKK